MEYTAFLLAALSVSLVDLVIVSYKYILMVRGTGEKLSFRHGFVSTNISQAASYLSPFMVGSVLVRPIVLKVLGKIPVKKSTAAVSCEYFFDLQIQLLMFPFLAIMLGEQAFLGSVFFEILILIFFVAFSVLMAKKYNTIITRLWFIKRYFPKRMRSFGKKHKMTKDNIIATIESSMNFLSDRTLLASILILTFLLVFLSPLVLQLSAMFFGVNLSYYTMFLVYWIPAIVGRLSGLPGGFGSRDAVMASMFLLFGTDLVTVLQIIITYRAVVIIPIFVISLVSTSFYGGRLKFANLLRKHRNE